MRFGLWIASIRVYVFTRTELYRHWFWCRQSNMASKYRDHNKSWLWCSLLKNKWGCFFNATMKVGNVYFLDDIFRWNPCWICCQIWAIYENGREVCGASSFNETYISMLKQLQIVREFLRVNGRSGVRTRDWQTMWVFVCRLLTDRVMATFYGANP